MRFPTSQHRHVALFRPFMAHGTAFLGFLVGGLTAPACVADPAPLAESGTPDDPSATSGDSADPSAADPVATGAMPDPSLAPPEDTDGTDACDFICPDGDAGYVPECTIWDQDCEAGQKCTSFTRDATTWNASRCAPVAEQPKAVGDTCTMQGERHSGMDDCDDASMCWNVDEATSQGSCAAFCAGDPSNPTCDDPETSCSILNQGFLTLCLQDCDPLAPACPEGQGCYAALDKIQCGTDRSEPGFGDYAQPCEYLNACHPGLMCVPAGSIPGCTGTSCCTPFCDLTAADPVANCPDKDAGQTCVPYFAENSGPPELAHVGVCAIEG